MRASAEPATAPRPTENGSPAAARPRPLEPGSAAEMRALKAELAAALVPARLTLEERAGALAETSRRLSRPGDPFRGAALRALVEEAGYATATAEAGLDATLRTWTPGAWLRLARSGREGGRRARTASPDPAGRARFQSASGGAGSDLAAVVPHVLGSALPAPNLLPLLMTLLAGRAVIARAGRHVPSLAAAALAALADVAPELAACAAVCRWPRERDDLTRVLFDGALVGSVTGGDSALAAVRPLLGPGTRLLAHPHRVSFAYVAPSALASESRLEEAGRALARDVALHDQLGCLSPVGVLVEAAEAVAGERVARALAAALGDLGGAWPRAAPPPAAAAAIRSWHDAFALRAAQGAPVSLRAGDGLAWSVAVLVETPPPRRSPLYRCVWVRPVEGPAEASEVLAPWRGRTAAVGAAGSPAERGGVQSLARELGASRSPAAGGMQSPPLAWRQDGLPPVRSLLP